MAQAWLENLLFTIFFVRGGVKIGGGAVGGSGIRGVGKGGVEICIFEQSNDLSGGEFG